MRFNPEAGFSFLEVLVAVIILSIALVVLSSNQIRSLKLVDRARSLDTATQLARTKMTELTFEAEAKGFEVLKDKESGEFNQEMYPGYRWNYWVETVPIPDFAKMLGTITGAGEEEDPENSGNAGLLAGPLKIIGKVWEQALRELHVEVAYKTPSGDRTIELVTQLISQNANTELQAALAGMAGGALGGGGAGQGGGTPP